MMKKTMTLTFIFILSLAGCSSSKKVASSKDQVQKKRAPASVGTSSKASAWGKPIADEAADFLEEVENAKARSY